MKNPNAEARLIDEGLRSRLYDSNNPDRGDNLLEQAGDNTNTVIEKNFHKGRRVIKRFGTFIVDGVKSVIGFRDDPRTDLEYIDNEDELEEIRKHDRNKRHHIEKLSEGIGAIKAKAQNLATGSTIYKRQSITQRNSIDGFRTSEILENSEVTHEKFSKTSKLSIK